MDKQCLNCGIEVSDTEALARKDDSTSWMCRECFDEEDPTHIQRMIRPKDIEWEMDWSGTKPDGSRRHPDKRDKEIIFEKEKALALLLLNDVIFINNHWWEKEWTEAARETTGLFVNCNDVFAWACADAEEIQSRELKELYGMYKENPRFGPTIWCMKKRKMMPQPPVTKHMMEHGVDMLALQEKYELKSNEPKGCTL